MPKVTLNTDLVPIDRLPELSDLEYTNYQIIQKNGSTYKIKSKDGGNKTTSELELLDLSNINVGTQFLDTSVNCKAIVVNDGVNNKLQYQDLNFVGISSALTWYSTINSSLISTQTIEIGGARFKNNGSTMEAVGAVDSYALGITGDGTTDDYTELTSALSFIIRELIIQNVTITLGTDFTFPASWKLSFRDGGYIKSLQNTLITIGSQINASPTQKIFMWEDDDSPKIVSPVLNVSPTTVNIYSTSSPLTTDWITTKGMGAGHYVRSISNVSDLGGNQYQLTISDDGWVNRSPNDTDEVYIHANIGGQFKLLRSKNTVAYPDWFGAKNFADDYDYDSYDSVQKCYDSCSTRVDGDDFTVLSNITHWSIYAISETVYAPSIGFTLDGRGGLAGLRPHINFPDGSILLSSPGHTTARKVIKGWRGGVTAFSTGSNTSKELTHIQAGGASNRIEDFWFNGGEGFYFQSINDAVITGGLIEGALWDMTFDYRQGGYPQTFTTDFSTDANQLDFNTPHRMVNGQALTLETTGTLPAGLSTGTTYYVVNATPKTLELVTAIGGTPVTLTSDGVGTHTALRTPTVRRNYGYGGAIDVSVSDCAFFLSQNGVEVRGYHQMLQFSNCRSFQMRGKYGLFLNGAQHVKVDGWFVQGGANNQPGVGTEHSGIKIFNSHHNELRGLKVYNAALGDLNEATYTTQIDNGIWVTGDSSNNYITFSEITGCEESGLRLDLDASRNYVKGGRIDGQGATTYGVNLRLNTGTGVFGVGYENIIEGIEVENCTNNYEVVNTSTVQRLVGCKSRNPVTAHWSNTGGNVTWIDVVECDIPSEEIDCTAITTSLRGGKRDIIFSANNSAYRVGDIRRQITESGSPYEQICTTRGTYSSAITVNWTATSGSDVLELDAQSIKAISSWYPRIYSLTGGVLSGFDVEFLKAGYKLTLADTVTDSGTKRVSLLSDPWRVIGYADCTASSAVVNLWAEYELAGTESLVVWNADGTDWLETSISALDAYILQMDQTPGSNDTGASIGVSSPVWATHTS